MTLRGIEVTAAQVYDALITSIENVYNDVILGGTIDQVKHPEEYKLFHNPFRVVDGPCYAFVIHGKGPAVGGQGEIFNEEDNQLTSSRVWIQDNNINNIKCWNNEVPATVVEEEGAHGRVANDARGAVFQMVKTFDYSDPHLAMAEDGTYQGNVVADMQVMVARAIKDGVLQNTPERQTLFSTISDDMIAWAESGTTQFVFSFRCNGDSMHHVVKGMVVIRVEDTEGFEIKGNSIQNIENLSVAPFDPSGCESYHAGASSENEDEQQLGNIRAISIAAVRGFINGSNSQIRNNNIMNLRSTNANVIIGIDVQGDSKATDIKGNFVDLKRDVGKSTDDQYIALRVREFADGTGADAISVQKNFLVQEAQLMNDFFIRRHNKRKLLAHQSGDIEWKNGGCPFAAGM
jgi:hypothetical protein